MPIQHIINGQVLHELSLTEFKAGLFQLSGENQDIFTSLLREFEKRSLEEVFYTTSSKNQGKNRIQIVFERMRRREARRHQNRLNSNMRNAGCTRYSGTSAHHIVAWQDKKAVVTREILQHFGIDIDDAANGVALPTGKRNIPHEKLPNAFAHTTVHTKLYYVNVTTLLENEARIKGTSREDIISILQEIAIDLQNGTFPINRRISRR